MWVKRPVFNLNSNDILFIWCILDILALLLDYAFDSISLAERC